MAAEKAILYILFEEFSELDEIGINTCLILQNTQETVIPNYCDPTFALRFRMKRQKFQLKDNPLLTSETVL